MKNCSGEHKARFGGIPEGCRKASDLVSEFNINRNLVDGLQLGGLNTRALLVEGSRFNSCHLQLRLGWGLRLDLFIFFAKLGGMYWRGRNLTSGKLLPIRVDYIK